MVVNWSKVSSTCPMCKRNFTRITQIAQEPVDDAQQLAGGKGKKRKAPKLKACTVKKKIQSVPYEDTGFDLIARREEEDGAEDAHAFLFRQIFGIRHPHRNPPEPSSNQTWLGAGSFINFLAQHSRRFQGPEYDSDDDDAPIWMTHPHLRPPFPRNMSDSSIASSAVSSVSSTPSIPYTPGTIVDLADDADAALASDSSTTIIPPRRSRVRSTVPVVVDLVNDDVSLITTTSTSSSSSSGGIRPTSSSSSGVEATISRPCSRSTSSSSRSTQPTPISSTSTTFTHPSVITIPSIEVIPSSASNGTSTSTVIIDTQSADTTPLVVTIADDGD